MVRKVAQFIFWDHLKATLWTSGIVVLLAALNQLGLVYLTLQSLFHTGSQTYRIIDAILGPVGLLSLFIYIFSFFLNRRRKSDSLLGDNRPASH